MTRALDVLDDNDVRELRDVWLSRVMFNPFVGWPPETRSFEQFCEANVYPGPWWCPSCSRAFDVTVSTNKGEPCCPKCGTPLEEQGSGDDEP